MTLGLGVLLSLFLLAPGLAIHTAMFPLGGSGGVRLAPPPPNSILALSIVGFGALVAHAIWSVVSVANDAFCDRFSCVSVPFEPNLYTAMMSANANAGVVSGDGVAASLVTILFLSFASWGITTLIVAQPSIAERLRGVRYGWLADFIDQASADNRFTTAFVLTDIEEGGVLLGYEGLLENLAVNSDREITAVTLLDVNRFLVTISATDVTRTDVPRNPIPRLYLEKSVIKNVALTVFEEDAGDEYDQNGE